MFKPLLAALPLVAALGGCVSEVDDGLSDGDGSASRGLVDADRVSPAWGPLSAQIRPGASLGGYCSFNFLYEDAQGNGYIGTAAHCTDQVGERVSLGSGGEIGTVVYDSDVQPGADPAVDFALILLDAEQIANANPKMLEGALFSADGPFGAITADEIAVGDEVYQYGYGILLGSSEVTRGRIGLLTDADERQYNIDMPAVNGDSGSPILHTSTGKALGIVSHYGIGAIPPSTDEGPLMPWIFEELAKAGFGDLRVATIE